MGKRGRKIPELRRTCPECHAQYSTSKHACPECGAGYRATRWRQATELEEHEDGLGMGYIGAQAGVSGGVVIIVVAVGWFLLDDHTSSIYSYPALLAVLGVSALVHGLRRAQVIRSHRRRGRRR